MSDDNKYRDMTDTDQANAEKWFHDNEISAPHCWGKDGTCANLGNYFIDGLEGIFCANCRNQIKGN